MRLFIWILILVDMFVNWTRHDDVLFTVLFNAGLLFIILLVYSVKSWVGGFSRNYQVGKGINDMYRHEHPSE